MAPIPVLTAIACVIAGALIGRRHRVRGALFGLAAGVACMVAIAGLQSIPSSPSGQTAPAARDYRDPAQLAEAMKTAENGTGASCAKMPTGKYFCSVATAGGAEGNYTVTVAADGSSYTAS